MLDVRGHGHVKTEQAAIGKTAEAAELMIASAACVGVPPKPEQHKAESWLTLSSHSPSNPPIYPCTSHRHWHPLPAQLEHALATDTLVPVTKPLLRSVQHQVCSIVAVLLMWLLQHPADGTN
jgi:hypothetical protein